MCMDAKAAWALAIRDCKDVAWVFTRKPVQPKQAYPEWALAWDTTVTSKGRESRLAIIECVDLKVSHLLQCTSVNLIVAVMKIMTICSDFSVVHTIIM